MTWLEGIMGEIKKVPYPEPDYSGRWHPYPTCCARIPMIYFWDNKQEYHGILLFQSSCDSAIQAVKEFETATGMDFNKSLHVSLEWILNQPLAPGD
jgi:hypothetical protein